MILVSSVSNHYKTKGMTDMKCICDNLFKELIIERMFREGIETDLGVAIYFRGNFICKDYKYQQVWGNHGREGVRQRCATTMTRELLTGKGFKSKPEGSPEIPVMLETLINWQEKDEEFYVPMNDTSYKIEALSCFSDPFNEIEVQIEFERDPRRECTFCEDYGIVRHGRKNSNDEFMCKICSDKYLEFIKHEH